MKKKLRNLFLDGRTGENVNYEKNYCSKCGCSQTFLSNHPKICRHCGNMVYPMKEMEFKEKMKMKLRKELKK